MFASILCQKRPPHPKKSTYGQIFEHHAGALPVVPPSMYHLVVAGGVSDWDEVLASVEVFDLIRKSIRRGGSLKRPRAYFQMIPVGLKHPRLLAIGGQDSNSTLSSSEWWDEEEDTWEDAPSLTTGRSSLSALLSPPHLVCPETNPLAHSCPALGDTEQMCTLEPGIHNQLSRGSAFGL